jgi:uncharacterized protein YndB with AHSA1/START domain
MPIREVSVHVVIARPPEAVWPYLTVDELVGRWFADSAGLGGGRGDHAARRAFRFEFGDGDFFAGNVTEWREPRVLGLHWQFMGIGPVYDIRIELVPCETGTRVTVTDAGASSASEAESLHEGWIDFLARLDKCISTGRVTRYEWSETISVTALVRRDEEAVAALLSQRPWWEARFPGAELRLAPLPTGVAVEFRDPAWQGASTRAEITVEADPGGLRIQVRHEGWTHLPPERRIPERRRLANLWASTLMRLEADLSN